MASAWSGLASAQHPTSPSRSPPRIIDQRATTLHAARPNCIYYGHCISNLFCVTLFLSHFLSAPLFVCLSLSFHSFSSLDLSFYLFFCRFLAVLLCFFPFLCVSLLPSLSLSFSLCFSVCSSVSHYFLLFFSIFLFLFLSLSPWFLVALSFAFFFSLFHSFPPFLTLFHSSSLLFLIFLFGLSSSLFPVFPPLFISVISTISFSLSLAVFLSPFSTLSRVAIRLPSYLRPAAAFALSRLVVPFLPFNFLFRISILLTRVVFLPALMILGKPRSVFRGS